MGVGVQEGGEVNSEEFLKSIPTEEAKRIIRVATFFAVGRTVIKYCSIIIGGFVLLHFVVKFW